MKKLHGETGGPVGVSLRSGKGDGLGFHALRPLLFVVVVELHRTSLRRSPEKPFPAWRGVVGVQYLED